MIERIKKPKEQEEFEQEVLHKTRTARMTSGGRRFRFRAVVIVGNKKGEVGVGIAQGRDVGQAISKAQKSAKKKTIFVPTKSGTIPHEVEAKFSSARVLLKPQRKGKGLIAGGAVRTICRLAGVKDISSKVLGRTKNKMNIANATIKALSKLKREQTIAQKYAASPDTTKTEK